MAVEAKGLEGPAAPADSCRDVVCNIFSILNIFFEFPTKSQPVQRETCFHSHICEWVEKEGIILKLEN